MLNRHERRALKSKARTGLGGIVAFHEAGHACGRVLAAPDFELPPEEMIDWIEIGVEYSISTIAATTSLISLAVTYGPLLSGPLQLAIDEQKNIGSEHTVQTIAASISQARRDGVNVDRWLRGQLLQITMGPGAESRYRGVPIEAIWRSEAAAKDRADAVRACVTYAGLSPEQAEVRIGEALARAEFLVQEAKVFSAIQSAC